MYNSFDGFDYIGNSKKKNKKSVEGNANIGFKNEKWQTKLSDWHTAQFLTGQGKGIFSTWQALSEKNYEMAQTASRSLDAIHKSIADKSWMMFSNTPVAQFWGTLRSVFSGRIEHWNDQSTAQFQFLKPLEQAWVSMKSKLADTVTTTKYLEDIMFIKGVSDVAAPFKSFLLKRFGLG